jgi:hypothetical protein
MKPESIPTCSITLRFALQHNLSQIRPELVGIDIEDAELIDAVGGIVEVLGVRPFEIPEETQSEILRQHPLFNGLFCLF